MSRFAIIVTVIICLCPFCAQSKEIEDLALTIEKATNGESTSQSNLVDYYYNTAKDYGEAIRWCNILIDNCNAEDHDKEYAYRILGLCEYKGRGVNKSIDDAIKHWKQGVRYNGGKSALCLAEAYSDELKDSVESIKWYQKSAELENMTSAYFLGQLYENGYVLTADGKKVFYPNVFKDISQAAKFYDLYIPKMGYRYWEVPVNPQIIYKVAQWYYTGEGSLQVNYKKAFEYFYNAIKENEDCEDKYRLTPEEEGDALWCISVCYRFGRGVEKDELTARRYAKRAAEKGNEKAIRLLSNLQK